MAILQTLFILKAQWLTCPDPEYLKSFLHQWLQIESWPRLSKHIDPEPTVWAGPTWTLSSVALLLNRSGRPNSSPCSCWEPKKRWCMIKQTAQCTRHSSGSPKCFSNRKSYPICICKWVCVCVYLKLQVGRETLLEQKKASLVSLLLVTLSPTCHCATQ